MKKLFVPILITLSFLACHKSGQVAPTPVVVKPQPVYDTIPDNATFALRFVQDSTYYYTVMFGFNHSASLKSLQSDGDVRYMNGLTPDVFYAIASDGGDLIQDYVPYSRGITFNLHVSDSNNGTFFLKYIVPVDIPASFHIWCKDNYLKDSVDVTHGAHCTFTIDNNNPETYGDRRFQLVFWPNLKN